MLLKSSLSTILKNKDRFFLFYNFCLDELLLRRTDIVGPLKFVLTRFDCICKCLLVIYFSSTDTILKSFLSNMGESMYILFNCSDN